MGEKHSTKKLLGFHRWFQRSMLSGFFGITLSFIGIIFFSKINLSNLSLFSVVLFLCFSVYLLAYLPYKVKNVRYPECDKNCKSRKDIIQNEWVAPCSNCRVDWRLELGAKLRNWS